MSSVVPGTPVCNHRGFCGDSYSAAESRIHPEAKKWCRFLECDKNNITRYITIAKHKKKIMFLWKAECSYFWADPGFWFTVVKAKTYRNAYIYAWGGLGESLLGHLLIWVGNNKARQCLALFISTSFFSVSLEHNYRKNNALGSWLAPTICKNCLLFRAGNSVLMCSRHLDLLLGHVIACTEFASKICQNVSPFINSKLLVLLEKVKQRPIIYVCFLFSCFLFL